ncbi:MAG: hypothetical protein M1828_006842 [Chrysothrix sp. TS-e1954]|nr:MAG: hypothetical protein M1828_006842 [Chrysothrix sp. TS-e1954]
MATVHASTSSVALGLDFSVDRPEWVWTHQYDAFRRMGSDIFLLVSPTRLVLWVADADVVNQIVNRRNDFPKPISLYAALDVYGKNVVSTEGTYWRHQRKITSPPFSESSNQLVWRESLAQAQSMLTGWRAHELATIPNIAGDTMRLSLHVISRAGFGVRLHWPHEEEEGSVKLPPNHTMTYGDALGTLLEHLITVMLIPQAILAWSPFKFQRTAHEAFVEWGKYMRELYQTKQEEIERGGATEGLDLMGALVSGAGTASGAAKGNANKPKAGSNMLSDTEVLGNAFVFILAGHETTANTIHFAFLYLALNPSAQAKVQENIVQLFGDRPSEQWNYEHDLPALFGSWVGAVLNETLRLIPPAIGIHKSTLKGSPQALNFNGRQIVVPDNVHIDLSANAVHRNPKYWPAGEAEHTGASLGSDLDQFKPERWFKQLRGNEVLDKQEGKSEESHDTHDLGGPQGPNTSASLFSPTRGSYIPFSEGARSCLGRRFAQVEVLAVLAVILRHYSVELAVDAFATDEEVDRFPKGGSERQRVWQKAADRAHDLLRNGMESLITIQLRKGSVPVRFVPKGEERFFVAP